MRFSRFFVAEPLQVGAMLSLPETASHHALRVLRLGLNDPVVLFNGQGGEYHGYIHSVGKTAVVQLTAFDPREAESGLTVHLVQALATGDKMDWVIEKAVELGAAVVQPIDSARSVLRLAGERSTKRHRHWQAIAIRASEQCGRNRVMRVCEPLAFAEGLRAVAAVPGTAKWILAPGASSIPAIGASAPAVVCMVGPEGGWTPEEVALAVAQGFTPVGLGPRVLRTETAGIAVLAALQAKYGDFMTVGQGVS